MSYRNGTTGRIFEREVFGAFFCEADIDFTKRVRREDAMAFAREHQPKAMSPIARNFLEAIADVMALSEEEKKNLHFYTALYTTFDVKYHVDAWIEYKGVAVTLDATLNPHKDRCYDGADIIIRDTDLDSDDHIGRHKAEWVSKILNKQLEEVA